MTKTKTYESDAAFEVRKILQYNKHFELERRSNDEFRPIRRRPKIQEWELISGIRLWKRRINKRIRDEKRRVNDKEKRTMEVEQSGYKIYLLSQSIKIKDELYPNFYQNLPKNIPSTEEIIDRLPPSELNRTET